KRSLAIAITPISHQQTTPSRAEASWARTDCVGRRSVFAIRYAETLGARSSQARWRAKGIERLREGGTPRAVGLP
ncbi:MAG: hypothetical protein FWD15_02570, partial [Alphaproteobacteria bacterium]|nr:hypothetical protein [Alphaproteobacteria bacterium]